MTSGNHLADQSDKDRDRKSKCSCGGSFVEIDWCAIDNCKCDDSSCPANLADTDCEMMETRLLCKKCGAVCENE